MLSKNFVTTFAYFLAEKPGVVMRAKNDPFSFLMHPELQARDLLKNNGGH